MTTAQLNTLSDLVRSQADEQKRHGRLIEEIATGMFGPQRTELQGGGRWRELGFVHRLDKTEADSLEAVKGVNRLNENVQNMERNIKSINRTLGKDGVPASVYVNWRGVNWRDRRTQIVLALLTLAGTIITAGGAIIGVLIVRGG